MSSLESLIAGAFRISASCLRLVALTIGAVMAGLAISHARAIWAGTAPWRAATLSSARRMLMPRPSRYRLSRPARPGSGAFFRRTIFSGQETGGERIIVDDAQFLLPANRLELGFEILAVGKIIERLQALVARQAEFPARLERSLKPGRSHVGGANHAYFAGG